MEELQELYSYIKKETRGYYKTSKEGERFQNAVKRAFRSGLLVNFDIYVPPKPNPKYPEEDFEDFVVRMINVKKDAIENNLKL